MKSLHLLSLLLIASFAPAFSFSPSVKCRERHHELKASRRQILQTIASTTSLFVPSIAQAADVKSLSLQKWINRGKSFGESAESAHFWNGRK